jgi:Flp pilus assembly protein TadG
MAILRTCREALRDFRRDREASVVMLFGLMLPVLVICVAMATDYALMINVQTKMQSAADSAAVAAARELQLANADSPRVTAVAEGYVRSTLPEVAVETSVEPSLGIVRVRLSKTFAPVFGGIVQNGATQIDVNATAKISGGLPLCLLALDPIVRGAVYLERRARMTGPGCAVYSNSENPNGLISQEDAVLRAGMTCSAGGVGKTQRGNFAPDPMTDCPPIPDPLASRPRPSASLCNYTNRVVDGITATLSPGVYCGGLQITDGAHVTLAPGIFVIKDGPLKVTRNASLRGTDVGIYLAGPGSNITFARSSTISLSAPKDGLMAGLLIYDDPSGALARANPPPPPQPGGNPARREHKILSDNARTLLGTIYMPQGRLIIDARRPIADRSAYTVLVVRQIDLHDGPNLVLNTDYGATDVPVPNGVGPYGGKVMLTN